MQDFGLRCNVFASPFQGFTSLSCCCLVSPTLSRFLHSPILPLPGSLSPFLWWSLPLLSPPEMYLSLHRGAGSMLRRHSTLHTSVFFSFCYFPSILFHFTLVGGDCYVHLPAFFLAGAHIYFLCIFMSRKVS